MLMAASEGALELRAFSAPRNGDLWSEVRPQLAADMARRGGTATEREIIADIRKIRSRVPRAGADVTITVAP